ncbi:imidazole glycerol phosphate synthase subunit HisH [Pedobacter sp.]|uniref:imidazole glycerol phosphate synthase subunit HisH n=1 Tax=Pedobacter sp. TaxID=1411316 RepID=UPI003BACFC65
MITIIDYGMGNLGSVLNMFKKVGATAKVSSDLNEISKAEKILLPGVGAFDTAMRKINEGELKAVLDHKALVEKVPVLGICLGMQLLTNNSEEGELDGLGWIDAETLDFSHRIDNGLKVPHMGWNIAEISQETPLTKDYQDEIRFYFVHSYFVKVKDEKNSMMKTHYGITYDSAIVKDNIFGAQFHPEKSHRFGMHLFKNFNQL